MLLEGSATVQDATEEKTGNTHTGARCLEKTEPGHQDKWETDSNGIICSAKSPSVLKESNLGTTEEENGDLESTEQEKMECGNQIEWQTNLKCPNSKGAMISSARSPSVLKKTRSANVETPEQEKMDSGSEEKWETSLKYSNSNGGSCCTPQNPPVLKKTCNGNGTTAVTELEIPEQEKIESRSEEEGDTSLKYSNSNGGSCFTPLNPSESKKMGHSYHITGDSQLKPPEKMECGHQREWETIVKVDDMKESNGIFPFSLTASKKMGDKCLNVGEAEEECADRKKMEDEDKVKAQTNLNINVVEESSVTCPFSVITSQKTRDDANARETQVECPDEGKTLFELKEEGRTSTNDPADKKSNGRCPFSVISSWLTENGNSKEEKMEVESLEEKITDYGHLDEGGTSVNLPSDQKSKGRCPVSIISSWLPKDNDSNEKKMKEQSLEEKKTEYGHLDERGTSVNLSSDQKSKGRCPVSIISSWLPKDDDSNEKKMEEQSLEEKKTEYGHLDERGTSVNLPSGQKSQGRCPLSIISSWLPKDDNSKEEKMEEQRLEEKRTEYGHLDERGTSANLPSDQKSKGRCPYSIISSWLPKDDDSNEKEMEEQSLEEKKTDYGHLDEGQTNLNLPSGQKSQGRCPLSIISSWLPKDNDSNENKVEEQSLEEKKTDYGHLDEGETSANVPVGQKSQGRCPLSIISSWLPKDDNSNEKKMEEQSLEEKKTDYGHLDERGTSVNLPSDQTSKGRCPVSIISSWLPKDDNSKEEKMEEQSLEEKKTDYGHLDEGGTSLNLPSDQKSKGRCPISIISSWLPKDGDSNEKKMEDESLEVKKTGPGDDRTEYGGVEAGTNLNQNQSCPYGFSSFPCKPLHIEAPSPRLAELLKGVDIPGDSLNPPEPPEWLDRDLFNEGRQFYKKYLFCLSFSELMSLVFGLANWSVLKVLIYTGKSDTPAKARRRYISTLLHLMAWFEGDVWEKSNPGHKDLMSVRNTHRRLGERFNRSEEYEKILNVSVAARGHPERPDSLLPALKKDMESAGLGTDEEVCPVVVSHGKEGKGRRQNIVIVKERKEGEEKTERKARQSREEEFKMKEEGRTDEKEGKERKKEDETGETERKAKRNREEEEFKMKEEGRTDEKDGKERKKEDETGETEREAKESREEEFKMKEEGRTDEKELKEEEKTERKPRPNREEEELKMKEEEAAKDGITDEKQDNETKIERKPNKNMEKEIVTIKEGMTDKDNIEQDQDQPFQLFISQLHMSITQYAFMGLLLSHPTKLGAGGATRRELESLVHFWRGLGWLLGIEDRFNFCSGTLEEVQELCVEVERKIFIPNLVAAKWDYRHMASCLINGMGQFLPMISFPSMLKHLAYVLDIPTPGLACVLTWRQTLQYWIMRSIFGIIYYMPSFLKKVNFGLLSAVAKVKKEDKENLIAYRKSQSALTLPCSVRKGVRGV